MSTVTRFPVVRYTIGLLLISSLALLGVFIAIYWNQQRDSQYLERMQGYHLASLEHIGTIKEGVYLIRLHLVSVDESPLTDPQFANNSLDMLNVTNELTLLANAAAALQSLQQRYGGPEFALPNERLQKSLELMLGHGPDELIRQVAADKAGGLLMVQLKQLERLHQFAYEDLHANEDVRKRTGRIVTVATILSIVLLSSALMFYLILRLRAALRGQRQAENELLGLNAQLDRRIRERTRSLEDARNEAERANRAKSEFLSHMSHELRTPMNAVLGAAELLDYGRDQLNTKQRTYVDMIKSGGGHLLDLINEILDLARIESGKYELQLERVCIGPIVQECVNLLAPVFQGRQLQLDNQIAVNGVCPVIADTKCLRQVLLNLMSNAVKYSRDGGHVLLHYEEDIHGRLKLGVTDTGPGIAPADQSRIFEPFSRLQKDTHVEGTGIGLTVSKQLVKLMGGELTLDSRPGEGSTFWIELNCVESEPLTANG